MVDRVEEAPYDFIAERIDSFVRLLEFIGRTDDAEARRVGFRMLDAIASTVEAATSKADVVPLRSVK